MVFHQGDRLEFRFFSPTLDARKLNFYVHLANVVYRRLAGRNAKLSKRAMSYFMEKMVDVNGVSKEQAELTIQSVNSIKPILEYRQTNVDSEEEVA
jgi:hypothetical protein